VALVSTAGALVGQERRAGADPAQRTLAHDGRQRTYLVHDFGRGGPAPVVIVLHGGGGNAANAVRMTSFDHVAGHSTRRRRCGHSSGISVAHAETIAVSHARE